MFLIYEWILLYLRYMYLFWSYRVMWSVSYCVFWEWGFVGLIWFLKYFYSDCTRHSCQIGLKCVKLNKSESLKSCLFIVILVRWTRNTLTTNFLRFLKFNCNWSQIDISVLYLKDKDQVKPFLHKWELACSL